MPKVLVDLLFYTGTKGGMETYARELYGLFGSIELDYEFVGYASREAMSMDLSWFPGEIIDSGISGENRWVWAFGELFLVARAARRLKADLIHSPATFGPWRSKVPAVHTIHDMLYFKLPDKMATPFYTRPVMWMQKRMAGNITRVMTDSESSKRDIQEFLHIAPDKIDVVLLAGSATPTDPADDVARERDQFLAVGNRMPHKNFDGLIRAIARIPEAERPRLVITGSRGNDPLVPLVEELGVGDSVDLKKWVSDDELRDLFARSSALMNPSFWDGFCLPALDAMLVGLPVLISDVPVYREVGGDAVGYFDPNDDQAIADAMIRAKNDPAWLAELSTLGRARAALFTWPKVAKETLETFDRALAASR